MAKADSIDGYSSTKAGPGWKACPACGGYVRGPLTKTCPKCLHEFAFKAKTQTATTATASKLNDALLFVVRKGSVEAARAALAGLKENPAMAFAIACGGIAEAQRELDNVAKLAIETKD